MLMLTMASCSDSVDNTGKCFKQKDDKYRVGFSMLIFNKDNDYIFWKTNYVYGPMVSANMYDTFGIKCPIELLDPMSYATDSLKRYEVYDEVTKYITITTTKR